MKIWIQIEEKMIVRIDHLSKALIKIFKETRNDITVYIG